MKVLFKHAAENKAYGICGPAFKALEATFELCVPLVMSKIIDIGIKQGDTGYILKMAGILIILGILGFAATVCAQYFSAAASVRIVDGIKRDMFEKIQSFSYSDIDNIGTSSLITRLTSDANQVLTGINLTLRLFIRSPFIVFGAMIMAFTVDAKAAVTFAVVIPLLSIVVFGIMLICIPLYKKVQSALDGLTSSSLENLKGVRVIRAFNNQDRETEKFRDKTELLFNRQTLVGKISALMNPLTYVLINFAVAALIYIGAFRVNSGALTQGQVVSLYNYMLLILVELIKLANLIITMTKSAACENRIESIINMPVSQSFEKKPVSTEKSENAVEFKNVSLKYSSDSANSLNGISFCAKKGEKIGIIGATGSGKSSLVSLIPRFYDATSGEVLLNGENVNSYPKDELCRKIGTVPQKAMLFAGTIRDNMLIGNRNASDEDIKYALTAAQAIDFVNDKGRDFKVEQGGKNFSGGQRQRLTIARALVKKPEVLILDDSASALDFATDLKLRKAISALDFKTTVFIVSQRTSSIKDCDKIIVLDDGKCVGMGSHDYLLENCGEYREIYDSQFKKEDEKWQSRNQHFRHIRADRLCVSAMTFITEIWTRNMLFAFRLKLQKR